MKKSEKKVRSFLSVQRSFEEKQIVLHPRTKRLRQKVIILSEMIAGNKSTIFCEAVRYLLQASPTTTRSARVWVESHGGGDVSWGLIWPNFGRPARPRARERARRGAQAS
jgi:hypothetical protein